MVDQIFTRDSMIDHATRMRIKQMWLAGASYGYIATSLGITRGVVSGVIVRARLQRRYRAPGQHHLHVEMLRISGRHVAELAQLAQDRGDTPLGIVEDMIDDAYDRRRMA